MKPSFHLVYLNERPAQSWLVTRQRAAYLLRAARSRRHGNAKRQHPGCYAIKDGNSILSRSAHVISYTTEPANYSSK